MVGENVGEPLVKPFFALFGLVAGPAAVQVVDGGLQAFVGELVDFLRDVAYLRGAEGVMVRFRRVGGRGGRRQYKG
ncbi:MAG TPA: hypothetical protein DCZ92_00105 [Elusimicrobia bacterium]|nr:hypothetical protein [Elusimicrobiota bacterium]